MIITTRLITTFVSTRILAFSTVLSEQISHKLNFILNYIKIKSTMTIYNKGDMNAFKIMAMSRVFHANPFAALSDDHEPVQVNSIKKTNDSYEQKYPDIDDYTIIAPCLVYGYNFADYEEKGQSPSEECKQFGHYFRMGVCDYCGQKSKCDYCDYYKGDCSFCHDTNDEPKSITVGSYHQTCGEKVGNFIDARDRVKASNGKKKYNNKDDPNVGRKRKYKYVDHRVVRSKVWEWKPKEWRARNRIRSNPVEEEESWKGDDEELETREQLQYDADMEYIYGSDNSDEWGFGCYW